MILRELVLFSSVVLVSGESVSGTALQKRGATDYNSLSDSHFLGTSSQTIEESIFRYQYGGESVQPRAPRTGAAFQNRTKDVEGTEHSQGVVPNLQENANLQYEFANPNVTNVVVISDRSQALLGSLGSLMLYTTVPVTVFVITRNAYLEQDLEPLMARMSSSLVHIHVLAFPTVLADLRSQKIVPVWEWEQFGASISNPEEWITDRTVRVNKWDNLTVHSNPMNLLRFYLPSLRQFKDLPWIVFMDDDILVKGDLARIRQIPLPPNKVQIATCELWKWERGKSGKCQSFSLSDRTPLAETDFMYLNGASQEAQTKEYVVALNAAIREINDMKPDLYSVNYWNYGFVKLNITEWRSANYTKRFETWMMRSYDEHIFPEYSLSYGLGIAQLALMDKVVCWDSVGVSISDGLGYVTDDDFSRQNLSVKSLDKSFVLHWSGGEKPFLSTPPQPFRSQWNEVLAKLSLPAVLDTVVPPTRQKALLVTDTPSGAEWFMDLMDQHPRISAAQGGMGMFPRESLITADMGGLGIDYCAQAVSCTWSFIAQWVPVFYRNRTEFCLTKNQLKPWTEVFPDAADVYRFNQQRICAWVDRFLEKDLHMTPQNLFNEYVEVAFSSESKSMLGCTTPPSKDVQVMKFVSHWWVGEQQETSKLDRRIFDFRVSTRTAVNLSSNMSKDFRVEEGFLNLYKTPELSINFGQFAIVLLSRENIFEQYIAAQVSQHAAKFPQQHKEAPIHIRVHHMLHYIDDQLRLRGSFMETLKTRNPNVLHITFEECVEDPQACMTKVEAHFDVGQFAVSVENFAKLARVDVFTHITNAEEVRTSLRQLGLSRWIRDESKLASSEGALTSASGANTRVHFTVPSVQLLYKPIAEERKPSYWWDGRNDRIVFLHIHRTGGSTLSQILGGVHFGTVNMSGELIPRHKLKEALSCLPDATCKIQNFASDSLDKRDLCWEDWPGATIHFIQRLHELKEANCRLVELHHFDITATMPFVRNGFKVISVVREPISHLRSRFEYELLRQWNASGKLLDMPEDTIWHKFEMWTNRQSSPQEALRLFTGCTNSRLPDPTYDLVLDQIEAASIGMCRYDYIDGNAKFDTATGAASRMMPFALQAAKRHVSTVLIFEAWHESLLLVSKKHRIPLVHDDLHLNSIGSRFEFRNLSLDTQWRLHARLLPDTLFYHLMVKQFADDAQANNVDLRHWYPACQCQDYREPASPGQVVCENKLSEIGYSARQCMLARADGTCELDQVKCVGQPLRSQTLMSKTMIKPPWEQKAEGRLARVFTSLLAFYYHPLGDPNPASPTQKRTYYARNGTYCGGSKTRRIVIETHWTIDQAMNVCDELEACLCVSKYKGPGANSGWEVLLFEDASEAQLAELTSLLWNADAHKRCDSAQMWLSGSARCFLRESKHWMSYVKKL